eukprot:COSAG02_NODE_862_length_16418_cov_5.730621_2_plen_46_part_00
MIPIAHIFLILILRAADLVNHIVALLEIAKLRSATRTARAVGARG